jgi:hypothetical protein
MAWIQSQGLPPSPSLTARIEQAMQYDSAVRERFGISVTQLALTSVLALIAIANRTTTRLRQLATVLTLGILVSVVWFLFGSVGWPRYLTQTMLVFLALLALVIGALKPVQALTYGAAALLMLLAVNYPKLPYVFSELDNGVAPNSRLLNALSVTRFVDSHADTSLFATDNWWDTVDIEYYSTRTQVFRRYSAVQNRPNIVLILNGRFASMEPTDLQSQPFFRTQFEKTLAHCKSVDREYTPYVVCNA